MLSRRQELMLKFLEISVLEIASNPALVLTPQEWEASSLVSQILYLYQQSIDNAHLVYKQS
jgi:hypothetical protein